MDTPQQNGRVERKHQDTLNIARALHFQAGLPLNFLGERVLTTVQLINRTPNSALNGKIPHEILHNQHPSYDHLRVFRCRCFVQNRLKTKNKFAS